jgi:hypothetical protein
MRITFDLPDDLIKRAKIAAISRKSSLRDLVAEPASSEPQRMTEAAMRQIEAGKRVAVTVHGRVVAELGGIEPIRGARSGRYHRARGRAWWGAARVAGDSRFARYGFRIDRQRSWRAVAERWGLLSAHRVTFFRSARLNVGGTCWWQ